MIIMKKILIFSLMTVATAVSTGHAAILEWWQQTDICRPNPTKCYAAMGAGYDDTAWDGTSNCWGMKYICPEALTTHSFYPVTVGRAEIAAGTGIRADFDTTSLNGDCFGVRKTSANGSMASIDGEFVNVWCNGILTSPDDRLPNGEITLGAQPTCQELAPDGWVAVLNQRCYGKYFNPADYFIECNGNATLPARLVVLNGATDYVQGTGSYHGTAPVDAAAASDIFQKMRTVSQRQHDIHFGSN